MNLIVLAIAVILATVAVFCGTVVVWGDKHGWPDDNDDFPRPDGGEIEEWPGRNDSPGPGHSTPARVRGQDRNRTDEEFDPDEER